MGLSKGSAAFTLALLILLLVWLAPRMGPAIPMGVPEVVHEVEPLATDPPLPCTVSLATTIDDFDFFTVENATRIAHELRRHDLNATFFIIPHNYPIEDLDREHIEELLAVQELGIEFALHGFEHKNPVTGSYKEFRGLNRSETFRRVAEGVRLFKGMGIRISGFRAPSLWSNPHLHDALRNAGLVYDSSHLDDTNPVPREENGLTVIPVVSAGMHLEDCRDLNASERTAIDEALWQDLKDAIERGGVFNIVLHVPEFWFCDALGFLVRLRDRAEREECSVESLTLLEVHERSESRRREGQSFK
ncbi:MAG: DUF2334 domain-containing protein [Methanopyri archaeon]|jgi:peptidoglycan/xylan/chitin deacetylase (PgdA/CDA1 family)|nr:DUF2334 domain-containing protein [Methanopyri archaeon]